MTAETKIELDDLVITITEKQPDGGYTAWFGDYDLDCMTGWGETRLAAASDLLDEWNYHTTKRLEKVLS